MARRMFSPKITSADRFLDMPVSARELYFQLGMNADDDGFVTPKKIMRMIGASEDDLKVLGAKGFIIPFQSGVIVISAWRVNNLIRKDWYQETIYLQEKSLLAIDSNGEYFLVNELVNENVPNSLTQVRLGKDRLDKKRDIMSSSDSTKQIFSNNFDNEDFESTPIHPNNKAALQEGAKRILQFLRVVTGTEFRDVDAHLDKIKARLKSGTTIIDCMGVIRVKADQWGADEKMAQYLRPSTLFAREKFEQYLAEFKTKIKNNGGHL